MYGEGLGLTGGFGVRLYTDIVISGGDCRGRRNQPVVDPGADYEISSRGAGGGPDAQPEGGALCPNHGERARPGREQPNCGLPTLEGFTGSRRCLGSRPQV